MRVFVIELITLAHFSRRRSDERTGWTETVHENGLAAELWYGCAQAYHRVSCTAMSIREYDCVVLTTDLPAESLVAGDVGTVVHVHPDAAAYEVEFAGFTGRTLALATVLPSQLRPVAPDDIAHARQTAASK